MTTQTTPATAEALVDTVECVLCYEQTADPVEVPCCGDELCCPECREAGEDVCPNCDYFDRRMSAWPER